MATEAKCAPRVAHGRASLAAAAAGVASQNSDPDTGFAAGWVAVWQACGGSILVTKPGGQRLLAFPAPEADDAISEVIGTTCLMLDEREVAGAIKALAVLLQVAGHAATDAVFALADSVREH